MKWIWLLLPPVHVVFDNCSIIEEQSSIFIKRDWKLSVGTVSLPVPLIITIQFPSSYINAEIKNYNHQVGNLKISTTSELVLLVSICGSREVFFPIEVTSNKRWKLHPGAWGDSWGGGRFPLSPTLNLAHPQKPTTVPSGCQENTSCGIIYLLNKPAHWSRKLLVNRKSKNKLLLQVRKEQMCRRIHN